MVVLSVAEPIVCKREVCLKFPFSLIGCGEMIEQRDRPVVVGGGGGRVQVLTDVTIMPVQCSPGVGGVVLGGCGGR
ncbi:hypothetical protein J6590_011373 [Homalodisca vitripennis]|nr:hypothetical protein J6590_011373 [Homalodisca vitripennis]